MSYIEYDKSQYELKFNLERLELIEKALGRPIITVYTENKGAFALNEMRLVFQISLKEVGSDYFCSNKKAKEIFESIIQQENGYKSTNAYIAEKLQEDCPFLFPTDL